MAAYVASARIRPPRPHFASASDVLPRSGYGEACDDERLVDTTPPGQRDLELRWEAIRERWSQLTFFLFDAESWRT
jgi:hypothetical protein